MLSKSKLVYYSEIVIIFGICVLIMLLPFAVNDKLINGIQSGKFFFFCYSILALIGIISINQLFRSNHYFKISIIDILFYTFILWVSINKFFLHEVYSFSFRYFELLSLVGLYFLIRNINAKYYILVLTGICISGIGQALYGNFQLWGIYPSLHGLFQMTGSFFNPGPYAGYLCGILPIAVGVYWMLKSEQNTISNKKYSSLLYSISRLIAIATIISTSLILPAAQSRAAWLGAIAGISFLAYHRYNINSIIGKYLYEKNLKSPFRKFGIKSRQLLVGSAIVAITAIICFGLYNFKKGSADGRILIWTVTSNIIKDYPILGVGQDQFKAFYCDYQADFFRINSGSPFETLAVDNQYVFNEFLNIWVENGIVGLLIFLFLLFFIFKNTINLRNIPPSLQNDIDLKGKKTILLSQLSAIQLALIVKASILSILVFSCFAYPSEILPIKAIVVASLAMLATVISSRKKHEANLLFNSMNTIWMKTFYSVFIAFVVLLGYTQLSTLKTACITWNNAYHLYQSKRYDDCLKEYEKAWPKLKNNGDYLLNYGKALSMAGRHEKAIEVLNHSKNYSTSSVYYTSIGDSYFAIHQNAKAEEAYQNAHFITPAKFYPDYLLAKYYSKTGDITNAKLMAQNVLQKRIKIKSTALDEIFQEMQIILKDGKIIQTIELLEGNQTTHLEHSHAIHNGLVPFGLMTDTCFDDFTEHNHINKKEVR